MLAFERIGSGPPLVLVHGVGHRRQAWYPVVDLLAPHRELILVDLPGHGESPALPTDAPVLDSLRDMFSAFLADQGLVRPHVAGNSLGGLVALKAGASGDAASVTALSPAGFWPSARAMSYTVRLFASVSVGARRMGPLAPLLARSTAGRAAMFGWLVTRPGRLTPARVLGDYRSFLAAQPALRAIIRAGLPFESGTGQFTEELPPELPVTIAWARRDLVLPPSHAAVARARIPQATHVMLPHCGHVPMSDDPELVARVLLRGSERGVNPDVVSDGDRHAG